ncbi:UDP-glucose 4-epimerase GalE [Ginsengibacter hankyongi]|uniref:UDP-glucose 4-epimerase n=1 Tax=Ginsengibacter hankyongi TaxID=2607284 RepID=A0A5J5IMC5_9BACT|nr:UDP-glucose 4-epimerase GalE [Ginsengibacter hankyongi]KAA9041901.1 UDP-glucose 4-epimerase GalE [Ginsengibacter hankyongi]
MNKKKILVTGGLGFIGSHTTVELFKAGYEVVIIDDLSNSQVFILDNIEKISGSKPSFYQLNMTDKKKLAEFFTKEKSIDSVIHFAAYKAVGESMQKPLKYFMNNLYSLINLLERMEVNDIKNIVFSSSATVYGEPDQLPVTENTPFKPALSAYGSTKQMGEDILQKVAATKVIDCISLRYFNPVGADSSALLGELPIGPPNNLMPFVTQAAAGIREQLVVFGNDYKTPDGTCIRDYIHVTDLAKAHVKSCDRLLNNEVQNNYEVFNIGTGNGISVLQIIEAFEKYNNIKLNYTIGKRRPGDAPEIYADVSRANKVLRWQTELGLKEMVTSAWEWQKKNNL